MEIVSLLIGILIGAVINAVIIWIVGKLGLGLEVSGFGAAFIAAIVIAVVGGVINWLLGLVGISVAGGWLGGIIHLIIAAIVLMVSDRFVKGMVVKGFLGAVVAAIAMGVVAWLLAWGASLLV